jgi:hypothetical protein
LQDISEVYRLAAQELGGTYRSSPGGNAHDEIVVTSGNWTVVTHRLRIGGAESDFRATTSHAFFVTRNNIRFMIKRSTIFHGLGTLLGMQDIEVGDAGFDADFTVKSSSKEQVIALLADEQIKQYLEMQHGSLLTIRDDDGLFTAKFRPDVDYLYFQHNQYLTDLESLVAVPRLMLATLNRLVAIGEAEDAAVGNPLIETA